MVFSIKTKALLLSFLYGFFIPHMTTTATAQVREIDSAYTRLDLDKCRFLTEEELGLPAANSTESGTGGGRWLCVGYNNYIVYVLESDLRFFISFGQNAMQEPAASQTFTAFNYPGEILEWRIEKIDGSWVPFATILRWKTQIGDGSRPDGSFLVVTKLETGNVCQVARIDAIRIVDANRLAREIADTKIDGFDCKNNQIIVLPE